MCPLVNRIRFLELSGLNEHRQLELLIRAVTKPFRKPVVVDPKTKQSFHDRRSLPGLFPPRLAQIAALLEEEASTFSHLVLSRFDQRHPAPARRKVLDQLFIPGVVLEFIEPRQQ